MLAWTAAFAHNHPNFNSLPPPHTQVDWYPWGAEAFEEARRQDRPIFLSVGYATCHW